MTKVVETCPECGAEQTEDTPFCEACGFRLGRSEVRAPQNHMAIDRATELDRAPVRPEDMELRTAHTIRHQPISKDMVAPALQKGKETLRDQPPVSSPSRALQTMREGHSPVSRQLVEQYQQGEITFAEDEEEVESTVLEGLSPVDPVRPADISGSRRLSVPEESGPRNRAPTDGPRPAVSRHEDEKNLSSTIILASGWLMAMLLLVAFVWLATSSHRQADVPSYPIPTNTRITIGAGEFTRGLSERVRAFMILTCHRVQSDRELCEEEILLAGEYPEEKVHLPAFAIDSHEVTNQQWQECVRAGGCEEVDWRACEVWTYQGRQIALRVPRALRADWSPVTCIQREQARAFCRWSGGRLPSEDEWEKAARGENGRLFPWGDHWDSEAANWGEMDIGQIHVPGKLDGFEWTAPPGSFEDGRSPYGLWDMAGNVSEWVDAEEGGQARGGSWTSLPFDLRTTVRLNVLPDVQRTDIGFRCAYDL